MAETKGRADVAVFARITAIERLATQRLERALPDGLSPTGLDVLNRLTLSPAAVTPQTLTNALLLSKSTMTHTLQRLERLELIAISADPADGRRKRVVLTAAGALAQREAAAALRPQVEAVRVALGADAFEAALPFLERLGAWLAENP
jgi:DNA-binding MarR family transcriptional regulator